MKISYVILHYMAGKDTIECVQSILESSKASEHQINIIVVDNGSINNSYRMIRNEFENNEKVIVLHSDENQGFAKGNNIGFRYAKEKCKADFIVLLNNDTIIQQNKFNEILIEKYEENQYAVLGPDILTLDHCHQNPGKNVNWSSWKLFKFRTKKKIQYIMAHFSIFDKILTLNENSYPQKKEEKDMFNVTLHGACLIFSPNYIEKFNGLFDKTFLYMEEDILKLRAVRYGYLMMYSPDLKILHKEDIATNMATDKSIEKKKWIYKNLLDSSKIYLKLKQQYKREMRN